MAFVTGLPVAASRPSPAWTTALSGAPLASPTARVARTRMGYGDYSYLTDKTKGHVNQYYVDKFRVAADFTKGVPASAADAVLGRDEKGALLVPSGGVPQPLDDALPPRDDSVDPDPRIAEAAGAVYPWDVNYVDPEFLPANYADPADPAVNDNAFAAFRESVASQRGAALTAMDFGAEARVQRIKAGLDERYLLCLDGALDVNYARLQKIADIPTLNPTGMPQTEIPGTPYVGSVGALDFQQKPGDDVAFWKAAPGAEPAALPYKKPSGSDTPDLPYNTSPTVDSLKEAQAARGLLPSQ